MLRNGLQYLLFKTGPVTTTGVEACAFIDPQGSGEDADPALLRAIVYLDRDVSGSSPRWRHADAVRATPEGARLGAAPLGRSEGPAGGRLNFFGEPDDLGCRWPGVRFAREVLERPADQRHDRGRDLSRRRQDDRRGPRAALQAHGQDQLPPGRHLPHGTGPTRWRFSTKGCGCAASRPAGVRCSMMPTIVSGNTNAPALAIADRAVKLMMEPRGAQVH